MRLSGDRAAGFLRAPDRGLAGALLHGLDESAVANAQRLLLEALLDDDRSALDRLEPSLIRRDPESLSTALKSRSFFGGRRVVLVEGATDSHARTIGDALGDVTPEDAFLLVTSRYLASRSTLRQLFDTSRSLASLAISAEPPRGSEIAARLEALGLTAGVNEDAREFLTSIAAGMDVGAFETLLETLAVYALDREEPLGTDDIAAIAPTGAESEMDDFVGAVADGRAELIGPLLRRVTASGVTPVGLVLALQRHFRQLLTASGAEGGPEAGMRLLRPQPFGARREAMRHQLQRWHPERIELAVRILFEIDSRLRSGERVPEMAVLERGALRLALMAGAVR